MDILSWAFISEILKVVPGIIMFPVAFYLGYKKIGARISATYVFGSDTLSAPRIKSLKLTNQKDKAVTIFNIFALTADNVSIELEDLDPPVVLKAFETVVIKTTPYSSIYVGNSEWRMVGSALMSPAFQIVLLTSNGVIKCQTAWLKDIHTYLKKRGYRPGSTFRRRFNGIVYDKFQKFAVVYSKEKEIRTFFVHERGVISNDKALPFNFIGEGHLVSAAALNNYLLSIETKFYDGFTVHELKHH